MIKERSYNTPNINVEKLIELLSSSYSSIINNKQPIKSFPSVMLWGAPGVGKSQAVRQIAREIEYKTKKKVNITDVRLLLFNPIDLRGIPTSNADKTLAIWLKPQIFQMDPSDKVVNILFLDEISAAPQSVQAAAYQITLDRVIGEHKLPDNCIVIAAGNRLNDGSVSYKMPKALANRLLHLEVDSTFASWRKWAIQNGINEKVIGFLEFRNDYLNQTSMKGDDLAFYTPRSWEMVSNILNNVNSDISKVYPLIAGLIGVGIAIEFRNWAEVYDKIPDVEDIFNGKDVKVPAQSDVLYALIGSMVSHARKYKSDLNKMANSIRYANKFPPEYAVILLKDYMYLEKNYRDTLIKIPEFAHWLKTKGRLLNATI